MPGTTTELGQTQDCPGKGPCMHLGAGWGLHKRLHNSAIIQTNVTTGPQRLQTQASTTPPPCKGILKFNPDNLILSAEY